MAEVQLEIGGRFYPVSCRDGEEPHLLKIAELVDAKATEARSAVGTGGEVRQLLLASLLLADELQEMRAASGAAPLVSPAVSAGNSAALEKLASQLEALASKLENNAKSV
jgi:cell division protein ZapA